MVSSIAITPLILMAGAFVFLKIYESFKQDKPDKDPLKMLLMFFVVAMMTVSAGLVTQLSDTIGFATETATATWQVVVTFMVLLTGAAFLWLLWFIFMHLFIPITQSMFRRHR